MISHLQKESILGFSNRLIERFNKFDDIVYSEIFRSYDISANDEFEFVLSSSQRREYPSIFRRGPLISETTCKGFISGGALTSRRDRPVGIVRRSRSGSHYV